MREININYKIIVHGDTDLQEIADVVFDSKAALHRDLQELSGDSPVTLLTYGNANELPVATQVTEKLNNQK